MHQLNKETAMLNKIITLATMAALAALLMPSRVDAWGAAHVGYTHVGPGGVYHTGRTVAAGPGGVYAGGRTGAYGAYGGAYRAGYGGAVGYGGAYRGYHYGAGYAGGVTYGAARYGYIR
jgi:heterogeneous nuclear ribonucleoprotein A1/A3